MPSEGRPTAAFQKKPGRSASENPPAKLLHAMRRVDEGFDSGVGSRKTRWLAGWLIRGGELLSFLHLALVQATCAEGLAARRRKALSRSPKASLQPGERARAQAERRRRWRR